MHLLLNTVSTTYAYHMYKYIDMHNMQLLKLKLNVVFMNFCTTVNFYMDLIWGIRKNKAMENRNLNTLKNCTYTVHVYSVKSRALFRIICLACSIRAIVCIV